VTSRQTIAGVPFSRWQLFAYGILGLPLTMAALPIYVHVPKFYADTLGVPIAIIGVILLAVRVLDALQDPARLSFAFGRFGRCWLRLEVAP